MASLNRFMAQRGQCSHFYSDNGTNFVGANRLLQTCLESEDTRNNVKEMMANHGIEWIFIPPSAPHFGGLWESAVKSAKKYLSKACASALFTFEEATTLLCRIEVVLNSRPLTPLSNDPSDFTGLTPAHFLTGGPLLFPPEPEEPMVIKNLLQRWKMVRAISQGFWKRWSLEYLPQLQKRQRWATPSQRVKIGDLAVLKEDNVSIMNWKLV